MLSSPMHLVTSFLLLFLLSSSIVEAFFSTTTTNTAARGRRATQSLVRRITTTTTFFGSLRDLVDDSTEGEDVTTNSNTKSSNNGSDGGGGARSDNFSGLINYSRSKFSDTKFRSRSVYGTGSGKEEEEELLGLNVDRLSPFSFSTSVPKSQSRGNDRSYDVNVMEKLDKALPRSSIATADGDDDDKNEMMVADRRSGFLTGKIDMVGTFYSKQSTFPNRDKQQISDAKDEKGQHTDRLSTFSLSSMNNKTPKQLKKKNTTTSGTVPAAAAADDIVAALAMGDGATADNIDLSIRVDNFHNQVDDSTRKSSTASTFSNLSSTPEGLDNHADRLSTYSLSKSPPITRVEGGGGRGRGGGTDEVVQVGLLKESTSMGLSPDRVYTPPTQKGSLSSIASSVSIKSRNERIKDIKEATDPKLLHPDGMNIPRLNSKGDVMTLSNTGGRKNIFERIDQAAAQQQEADPTEGMNGIEYDTSSNFLGETSV